ncbi:MAG: nucleotidyltransferase family protein [Clostridiaceae bacterium]|nr:nucleotidyltransferase family protein [Eubacteriales bacterium]
MKLGCILMAAGSGSRFGVNKLDAMFEGKTLAERALCVIPEGEFYKVAVVTQYPRVIELAKSRGFLAIENDRPEDGISRTIRLGMDALKDADALMFLVADQPKLRRESVEAEIAYFRANPDNLVAMGHGTRRGNPAIFPKRFFEDLRGLYEDSGGSEVIRNHSEDLLLFELEDELELYDVDSVAELTRLKELTKEQNGA